MSERARPLGLGERLEVEAALERAFAPMRSRRATVGPTRVRAAVRWGRVEPAAPVPWVAAVSRISELGVAVGMSAFVFAAALTSVPPTGAPVPVSEVEVVDDMLVAPVQVALQRWTVRIIPPADDLDDRFVRWLKLGRTVPMDDRIDATIPPPVLEAEQPAESLHLRLLRMLIPAR